MNPQVTPERLEKFKAALLEQQTRLTQDRDDYRSRLMSGSEEEAVSELSDYDPNDPADEASNLFDRQRLRATLDSVEGILSKIDRALAKIDEGTYGLSDLDGTPIPLARLEDLPYALNTVEQEELPF